MLLLAHRGYHADVPENTMAAFEAALRLGSDRIETDVRLSRDGLSAITHDRRTPRLRAIVELTRREIESDVGHPVPLLDEALDAFPDLLWNVEIKNPEALPAAMRVLKQFQRRRRLLVTSFRHDVVMQRAGELEADCGLLLADRPLEVGAVMAGCAAQPRIRAIVWDFNIIDDAVLQQVSAAGWGNYVYGAVTPAEHRHCATLGLAGLITDYPQYILHRQSTAGKG